jgi:hypothetical protein
MSFDQSYLSIKKEQKLLSFFERLFLETLVFFFVISFKKKFALVGQIDPPMKKTFFGLSDS